MPSPFLPDGYTRFARLYGDDQAGGPAFEYRPMLAGDRAALQARLRRLAAAGPVGEARALQLVFDELAARIVLWTFADRDGRPLPATAISLLRLPIESLRGLIALVLGFRDDAPARQAADEDNLRRGVRLILAAPQVAARDCDDCQRHVYDEQSGRRAQHNGRPVPRPAGTQPPCRLPHVGCAKGTPETRRTLSPENEQAWRFDRECRAVGRYPHDPIVRRHARLIRDVEDSLRPPHGTPSRGASN